MTAATTPEAAARSTTTTACDHCGLPVPRALVQESEPLQFCCHGCRTAYETIHACGLDDYYRLRDQFAGAAQASGTTSGQYAAMDSTAFVDKYVRALDGSLRTIELRLEGVHCAACVWLVERLPRVLPGVIEARLHLRESVLVLTWDDSQVTLSRIARALDSLGYPPHPARGISARDLRKKSERRQLIQMGVAGACAGNTMLLAVALYAGLFDGIEAEFSTYFRYLSLLIGGVALLWPGAVFFRGAWAAIRARTTSLDVPIALALAVGGLAGLVNTVLGRGEIYFDSLSVLVFLLLVGRWVQARQQRWADDAVDLVMSLTPVTCRLVQEGVAIEQPIESLRAGDTVEVRSGDLFPADGTVSQGESTVNRALVTGESHAVPVGVGDTVLAGTQNTGDVLRVQVEAVGTDTRVARLMELVATGVRNKPPIVALTDRLAGRFTVVVSAIALAVLIVWSFRAGVATAIDHTVALLIVACPCALGLVTPLTMGVAIGQAARGQSLVKQGAALELLARGGRLLLDKTGTLTQGQPRVLDWHGDPKLVPLVAEVERPSTHPVARGLVAYAESTGSDDSMEIRIAARQERTSGVSATVNGTELIVGSPSMVRSAGVSTADELTRVIEDHQSRGHTVVVVAVDGVARGVAALGDAIRVDSAAAVRELRVLGWQAEVLSGDAQAVVDRVAAEVGIEPARAHGQIDPETKLRVAQGTAAKSSADVRVMVGDGVNDAAALAAADVGIAVQGGAEASLAAADIYLGRPGLDPLVKLVQLAQRTMRTIRRNLLVSLGYNTLAISLAAAGCISPLVAALLMPLSSATVLTLALVSLRRYEA